MKSYIITELILTGGNNMHLKKLEMNKCKNDENIPVFLAVIKNDIVQRIRDCG